MRNYRERLGGVPGVSIPWTADDVERSSHFGFAILLESESERDAVAAALTDRGIQTTHYPSITALSAYRDHPPRPRSEEVAARHLVLPLSSTYTDREVDLVAAHLTEIMAGRAAPAR